MQAANKMKYHQHSAIVGRNQFIFSCTLFLKKDTLAACNRNVNQRVNLPIRPWPALPMLTQVSWDRKTKKDPKFKLYSFLHRDLAGITFYTAVHAWDN